MDLVLITDPCKPEEEVETLIQLLDQGLYRLHIRKPDWEAEELTNLLDNIPREYYSKISLHGDLKIAERLGLGGCHFKSHQFPTNSRLVKSKSFHQLGELLAVENDKLDYGFLSPVFNSISKVNYTNAFDHRDLKSWISKNKQNLGFGLYALGGIIPENVADVKAMGFDGIAILGSIWKTEGASNRLALYQQFQKQIQYAK